MDYIARFGKFLREEKVFKRYLELSDDKDYERFFDEHKPSQFVTYAFCRGEIEEPLHEDEDEDWYDIMKAWDKILEDEYDYNISADGDG